MRRSPVTGAQHSLGEWGPRLGPSSCSLALHKPCSLGPVAVTAASSVPGLTKKWHEQKQVCPVLPQVAPAWLHPLPGRDWGPLTQPLLSV